MNFNGSQTEKNLLAAFAGESQARNKYTFLASAAKKEGYEQIAAIFEETAGNEKEHSELFFKHLKGGMVEIQRTQTLATVAQGVLRVNALQPQTFLVGPNPTCR